MRRRNAAQSTNQPDTPAVITAAIPIVRVQLVRERTRRFQAIIDTPEAAATVIADYLVRVDREHFVVLMLDTQNGLLAVHTVAIGTLTGCLVSPRDVFKAAILANAASIIVGHNHPSGDPSPSPEDLRVTQTLRKAGELLDIDVLDHVVVGADGKHASLKRMGAFSHGFPEPP